MKQRKIRLSGRRGAVLVEFVMIIPFLALIIALTFFFGWAMTNQQHVRASSRYTAWRQVRTGETVGAEEGGLNEMFFFEQADNIAVSRSNGPSDTLEELVQAAGDISEQAQALADDAVMNHWTRGRTARVSAEFPSNVAIWQKFEGAIRGYHAREGVEWRRGDVSYLDTIKDQFLTELDNTVSTIEDTKLQANIRSMYLQRW